MSRKKRQTYADDLRWFEGAWTWILACLLFWGTVAYCATGCVMAPKKPEHIAFIGTGIADVATTQAALDRGAREVNPIFGSDPSAGKMLAIKGGFYFGLRALENYGEKHNWPGWIMKVIWWGNAGVNGAAAVHNHGVNR